MFILLCSQKKNWFVFACVCVCVSICFQQGGNYVKVRIRSRRQDCSPKTSTCRRGQRRYHYHRGHYHRRINRQINFFFFLISKCLRTYLHSGHQVPPFQVWWEYCEKPDIRKTSVHCVSNVLFQRCFQFYKKVILKTLQCVIVQFEFFWFVT